ncbi:MFS transporter [Patulibacter sp. SYSU D01012]|uniref:MFS transporter n=1 Tax=Patulibacter sp. SYSU D01012 TaxID=2817381 RepID=UPI001B315FD5|nr:MFS transporter [Patulibacter sp. SYSU D01012]
MQAARNAAAPSPGAAGSAAPRPAGGLGRAWWIWGVGASAYLVAMLHRMALGVAGSDAAERFGVPVGQLAVFTSLQLVLYLAMQIPAGLLADRFGPRRTLAIGLALMAGGELLFGLAHSMGLGLVGRALVGIGDALTFLNVLRLAHAWFPSRMQTLLAALTGFAGALGQLVSTVPLEASLDGLGWGGTFLGLAAVTAVLVAVPLTLVQDRPGAARGRRAPGSETTHVQHEPILRTVVDAWRRPATRQGFFVHMATLTPFMVTGAVWGVPYLQGTQDMSRASAASFLLVGSLAFCVTGPLVGLLVGDRARRGRIAAVVFPATSTGAWLVLMAWPGGTVPRAVLLIALLVTGAGAGASMLGFEIARRAAPPAASGAAAALVNCGGFSASVVAALVVGRLIGDGGGSASATQHAMLPVLAATALGLVGSLLSGRTARRAAGPERAAQARAGVAAD